jgi:hypothetical protein
MDSVIAEVDRLAYQRGTNRSNMINQILAEYVSMTTPEKRISNVFDQLASYLYSGEIFREMAPPTHSVMSICSALTYKYNPTVKYSVELYREPKGEQGVIRVSIRSTNSVLLMEMLNFYKLWASIELRYGFSGKDIYEDGIFKRPIIIRNSPLANKDSDDATNVGEMLATYISLFDSAMKKYFSDKENAKDKISAMYYDYLLKNNKIV